MAHSFLLFDFGSDESAAQNARHKIEALKQAFRLGNKILLKFERVAPEESSSTGDGAAAESKSSAKKKKSADKEGGSAEPGSNDRIRLLLRLDFSDHEKLSHQRWLDRIPAEDAFKSARCETLRPSDPAFSKTSDLFDSLP
ncbi:MAG TPA: hypothetical protein VEU52_02325 [Candidatus Limnocylindrales bacterium]|nr:hypothetical protein [Candidatus Limnocylindrales bacterium]